MAAKREPTTPLTGKDKLRGLTPGNPGNSGGKKGRSGRPPNEFKVFCARLAKDPAFQRALKRAATNDNHQSFIGAAKLVAAYAEGLPRQHINQEITGRDGTPLIPLATIRAAVAAADRAEGDEFEPVNRLNGKNGHHA